MLNAILKRLSEEESIASLLRHVFVHGNDFGKSQLSIILKDLLERVWLNFRDFVDHVTGKPKKTEMTQGPDAQPSLFGARKLSSEQPDPHDKSVHDQDFVRSLPAFRRNDAVYNSLVEALQAQLLSIWAENAAAQAGQGSKDRIDGHQSFYLRPVCATYRD